CQFIFFNSSTSEASDYIIRSLSVSRTACSQKRSQETKDMIHNTLSNLQKLFQAVCKLLLNHHRCSLLNGQLGHNGGPFQGRQLCLKLWQGIQWLLPPVRKILSVKRKIAGD